jgi:hypothetical protein
MNLSALRGRPTLMFLFATYDGISQIALAPLVAASERDDRVTFIGVAVQPDAGEFLPMFREALDVQFELYFDAKGALLHETTALGKLPGVPAFVAIDSEGYIRRTFVGVARREDLEALIESAL